MPLHPGRSPSGTRLGLPHGELPSIYVLMTTLVESLLTTPLPSGALTWIAMVWFRTAASSGGPVSMHSIPAVASPVAASVRERTSIGRLAGEDARPGFA
jgi:hypothetical protein